VAFVQSFRRFHYADNLSLQALPKLFQPLGFFFFAKIQACPALTQNERMRVAGALP